MSKNCEYVSKIDVKNYKEIMIDTIPKVQKDVKQEYGKTFNYMLVGSARRKLVIQKGDNHWDVDYQFVFHSPIFHEQDAPMLKIFISDCFKYHLGKKHSVKLSTSVITICLMADEGNHAIKSFDIALIKPHKKLSNKKEILKGTTDNETQENNYIKWELLSDSPYYKNRSKIKGIKMWKTFREIFKLKKCAEMIASKDMQRPAFSLYLETIKETLDK